MAVTEQSYTGNGSTTNYSFTFPYLKSTDVEVQVDATVTTAWSFANATTVQFNSAPASGAKIKILRQTNVDSLTATFYPGSAIKSEDLNDNYTQNLYKTQEVGNRFFQTTGGTMTGDLTLGEDVTLTFEGATDNAHETKLTVADPTADRTITLPNVTGTVVTTGDTGTVTSTMIAPNSVNSSELIDGSVDLSHMSANSVDSAQYVDGSIDTVHISADAITGAKIANNAINSEHYTNGSIDSAHLSGDCIIGSKIANNAIDSEHYVDGSIDTAHIGNAQVTSAKIADDAVGTAQLIDASVNADRIASNAVTTAKIQDDAVTSAKIAANAVTTTEIADAELTTLAGMQTGTASILAGGTALTATLSEINAVVDGKTVQTTISDTDASYPTSGAVVDYVAAQIAPLGGLEVIANEDSFPTIPASGVVISIADAGGIVVNGSGVSTTARTAGNGSDNVTINGFPSSLYSTTLTDNMGLMVSSTGSSNTYTYHKLLGKEDDIKQLSDDINDFAARYRVASSAPSSSLDNGDLWYDTANAKMMVYSGTNSAWEEVTSTGDFYINTISSYSGTGGNNATFNGTAYRFVLSNPPSSAQQLIVSVNGVIQKPNSGTGQPSEGFALNGSSIVFSAAPATGADYFIVTVGSTVAIGTPSDNTVATAKIQNLAVTGDKIATNLDLADNKKIRFGTGNDLEIFHDGSHSKIKQVGTGNLNVYADTFKIVDNSNGDNMINANRDGNVELYYDNSKKFETTSTGITVTGSDTTGSVVQGDFRLKKADATQHIVYDASNARMNFADSVSATFGDANDLEIYHNGTQNIIGDTTTQLRLISDAIRLRSHTGSETYLECDVNGAVKIYNDNEQVFETNASGVKVSNPNGEGTITIEGGEGASATLYLYADQADDDNDKFRIRSTNGGNFWIENNGNGSTWEDNLKAIVDGAVNLYYDGSKKFETTADGAKVTATTGTGLEIGVNHTAHGQGPAILINAHGAYNDAYIRYNLGNETSSWALGVDDTQDCFGLYFSGSTTTESPDTAGRRIIANETGSVELYHDNSKRFETTSDGAKLSGTGDVTFIINADTDNSGENDNPLLKFQQDGAVNCLGIGVIGDAGEYFSNSSQNSPYIEALDGHGGLGLEFATNNYRRMRINHGGTIDGDFNDTSDGNLKENIVSIGSSIDKVKTLRPVTFDWKDATKAKNYSGFIAQEVKTVYPNLVSGEEHTAEEPWKNYSLNTTGLVAHLTKALQEAITKIETLETKVAALEAK